MDLYRGIAKQETTLLRAPFLRESITRVLLQRGHIRQASWTSEK
jgi:hypothetical protein